MQAKEMFDALVPEEKQIAFFNAIKDGLPTYKILKKPRIMGKRYKLAILFEQHICVEHQLLNLFAFLDGFIAPAKRGDIRRALLEAIPPYEQKEFLVYDGKPYATALLIHEGSQ